METTMTNSPSLLQVAEEECAMLERFLQEVPEAIEQLDAQDAREFAMLESMALPVLVTLRNLPVSGLLEYITVVLSTQPHPTVDALIRHALLLGALVGNLYQVADEKTLTEYRQVKKLCEHCSNSCGKKKKEGAC